MFKIIQDFIKWVIGSEKKTDKNENANEVANNDTNSKSTQIINRPPPIQKLADLKVTPASKQKPQRVGGGPTDKQVTPKYHNATRWIGSNSKEIEEKKEKTEIGCWS